MGKTEVTIAGIGISMETPWRERLSESFLPFMQGEVEASYDAAFCERPSLEKITKSPVFQNTGYAVYEDGEGGYLWTFHSLPRITEAYAMTRLDLKKRKVLVEYLPGSEWCFGSQKQDFSYICWERLLIHDQRLNLHAACVDTDFGGILFSGPSGIGKSTQAELWCKFADARLLNGDRPILSEKASGWMAYGSPYAGSSNCYRNESTKIRAIVMLKQAKECTIRKLRTTEAFRSIYREVTIHPWDKAFVLTAGDLVQKLVLEIPVYELSCTPDERAVELLKNTLREENFGECQRT